jgi:cytochrome c551
VTLTVFIVLWLVLGAVVLYVAFSGGPGRAREAYLTRANRFFKLVVPAVLVLLGIGVPAAVIAASAESEGGTPLLADREAEDPQLEDGKQLFLGACASCHNLDATNARGVTGPDLDEIGSLSEQRVLNAIRNGGTGKGRMPAGIYDGPEAEAVAAYVSAVAGR